MRTLAEAMAQGRGKLMHEQIVQETMKIMSPVFALDQFGQRDFLEATNKYMESSVSSPLSERIPRAMGHAFTYMKGYTSLSDEVKQNLANALMQYNQVCKTVRDQMMHGSPQEYIDAKLYDVTPEEGKPIAAAFIDQLRRMSPNMPAETAMEQAFAIATGRAAPQPEKTQAKVQFEPTPVPQKQMSNTVVLQNAMFTNMVTQRLATYVWQEASQGQYSNPQEEKLFTSLVAQGYEQADGVTPAEKTPEALAYAQYHFVQQQPGCPILSNLDDACAGYEDSAYAVLESMKVGTTEEYLAAMCYGVAEKDSQRIAKIFAEKLPEAYADQPDKDIAYANAMLSTVEQLQSEYRGNGIPIPDSIKNLSSDVMDTLENLGEDPYGLGDIPWEDL